MAPWHLPRCGGEPIYRGISPYPGPASYPADLVELSCHGGLQYRSTPCTLQAAGAGPRTGDFTPGGGSHRSSPCAGRCRGRPDRRDCPGPAQARCASSISASRAGCRRCSITHRSAGPSHLRHDFPRMITARSRQLGCPALEAASDQSAAVAGAPSPSAPEGALPRVCRAAQRRVASLSNALLAAPGPGPTPGHHPAV